MPRCPGQDQRYWTPDDIFDVRCPYCDNLIEFWKDEPVRVCKACSNEIPNPRIDLGCAQWCQYGQECTGKTAEQDVLEAPLADRLEAKLKRQCHIPADRLDRATSVRRAAEVLLQTEDAQAHIVKLAAMMLGATLDETGNMQADWLSADDSAQKCPSLATLLQSLALPPADVTDVETICRAVAAGKCLETIECAVVWDSVQIVRQKLMQKALRGSGTVPAEADACKTETGKSVFHDQSSG